MEIIGKKFYQRFPDKVARDLLGKLLVRKLDKNLLVGKIVETEAYFDRHDPASRAAVSEKWHKKMLRDVGKTFIYMVHNNWLLNIIAHKKQDAGAVLIRAVEPLKGTELMKKFRNADKLEFLTNGPGKLTQAFKIDKTFDNIPVYVEKSPLIIARTKEEENFEIIEAFRIGVKKDLSEPMRFYISGNKFVSKK